MNKRIFKIAGIFFFVSVVFASCEKNKETEVEENCVGENYTIQVDKFINKLEVTFPGFLPVIKTHAYTYNEFNLLSEHNLYNMDIDVKKFYNYVCNNNLKEITSNDTNPKNYKYDDENRLIHFASTSSFNNDYTLSYDANLVSVKGNINTEQDVELTLEMNQLGLVSKITRKDNYSTFEYDTDGNLTVAKDLDLSDNLLREYVITYDQNPNPFYGQFKANYLERFLYFFSKDVRFGIDIFSRFNQFEFPYLKNNLILIKDKSCAPCYDKLLERVYVYDDQNYPKEIDESYVGSPSVTYKFEYK
mgnify:CR=1 FL=1